MIETIISSALQVYTSTCIALTLSERKKNQHSIIGFSLFVTIFVMFSAIIELAFLPNLIMIILLFIYLYKDASYLGISKTFFFSIISILTVSLTAYLLYSLLYYIPLDFPIHFVSLLITFFIFFFGLNILNFLNYLKAFSYSSLICLISATIFLIISFPKEIDPTLKVESLTNKLTLALAVFFVFLSITTLSVGLLLEKKKEKKKNLDAMIDYTAELESMHDELELFKHDYLNILLSLGESIYEKDIDKIERVYNETIRPTEKIMCHYNSNSAKMNKIKITEIKSILISKVFQAERSTLSIVLEIANPVTDVFIDTIDFIRICSIVLDNAIEAALKTSEKNMYVCLLQSEEELLFLVSNSYEDKQLIKDNIFEKNYSTKQDHSKNQGLGLYSLNRIIERHPFITLGTEISNGYFQQNITIKKPRTT